ncbi:MAG: hypothetical protein P8X79_02970 [Reinekea sp.]
MSKLKDRLKFSALRNPVRSEADQTVTPKTVVDMAVQVSRKVAGPNGIFYLLPPGGGKLHRYDPATDELVSTHIDNIADIKIGPDGHLYALTKANDSSALLMRLDLNGMSPMRQTDRLCIPVGSDLRDMAFTKGGTSLFTVNSQGEVNHRYTRSADATDHPVELPSALASRVPRGIAVDSRGSVWVMDEQNGVWKADAAKLVKGDNSAWQRIEGLSGRLDGLETLPDGDVAVRDVQGQLFRAGHPDQSGNDESWEPVPFDTLSEPLFRRLHKALHATNSWELLTFFGATGSARTPERKGVINMLKHPGHALKKIFTEDLPTTYKNLWHFEYAKKQQGNPMVLYNKQLDTYSKMLTDQKAAELQPIQKMPEALEILERGIGSHITKRSGKLLDGLILDANDRKTRKVLTKMPNEVSVNSPQNLLSQVKEVRTAIYGKQDSVVKRLDQLLKDNIFINTDTPYKRGLIGEMVADYAILADTVKQLIPASGMESYQELVLNARTTQESDSLPHLIARSGIAKTDPLGNAAKAFESLQAIFRQDNDMLGRITDKYAPALGTPGRDSSKSSAVADSAELFRRMVNTMNPGESFKLGKSAINGLNTDTFRFVWSGPFKVMADSVAVSWLIPILDVGKLKGVELNMSKTEDGMIFEVKKSSGGFGQLGFRTGVGNVNLPEGVDSDDAQRTHKSWIFQGWEIAIKGKYSRSKEDSIAFTLKDNGEGNIADAVTSIMSGTADIFDLMRHSEEVKSSHSYGRDWNFSVGNVGVLASGLEMPNCDAHEEGESDSEGEGEGNKASALLLPNAKPLTAFVPEVIMNFGDKKRKTETTSSSGMVSQSTTRQNFGLQDARFNFVQANVLETDALKAPSPIALNECHTGVNGRFGVPSILPGGVIGKSFDRLAPISRKVEMYSDVNGAPININVELTVSRSGTLLNAVDEDRKLRRNIPGLQQALDTLLHQQGKSGLNMNKPVLVSMELKPEVLKQLPENKEARERQMKACANDLSNFRITGLNVTQAHVGNRAKVLPVPAVTRVRTASLGTDTKAGQVSFVYDKNQILEHGRNLLNTLASFDDSIWGTSKRCAHQLYIAGELDNIALALGREPEAFRDKGDSLVESYRLLSQKHIDNFTRTMRESVLNTDTKPDIEKGLEALDTLMAELDKMRAELTRGMTDDGSPVEFEGPAILTSGPLFAQAFAGRMKESAMLVRHTDVNWDSTKETMSRLNEINLSELRGRSITREKIGRNTPWNMLVRGIEKLSGSDLSSIKIETQTPLRRTNAAVRRDIDQIKRTLNASYDLNPERKRDFLAKLEVLAVGRPDPALLEELNDMLSRLRDN